LILNARVERRKPRVDSRTGTFVECATFCSSKSTSLTSFSGSAYRVKQTDLTLIVEYILPQSSLHCSPPASSILHYTPRLSACTLAMNIFEIQRLENIKHNQKLLAQLSLYRHEINVEPRADAQPPPVKRCKLERFPSRTSPRIASARRPSYNEDGGEKYTYVGHVRPAKKKASEVRKQNAEQDEIEDAALVPARDADAI
jgi:hypothetical protein